MVIRDVYRLSRILLLCSAQVHFSDFFNHVCDLCLFSYPDVFFSPGMVLLNIFLSIFVCAAASLFFAWLLSAQASAPYVIAGSTQEL